MSAYRDYTMKKILLIATAGLVLFGLIGTPVSAQGMTESYSIGGGYWSMPNLDTDSGAIDSSGYYASISMLSSNYYMEFDYSFEDPEFFCLAADYIYPIDQSAGMFGGSTFLGGGYTYFSSDDIGNESGLNILAGASLSQGLMGVIRYDFLGSDQELLTFGVTYSF